MVTVATVPTNRGHRSGASTTTVAPARLSTFGSGSTSGTVSGNPKCAASSRAMPTIAIASGRFGVIARWNTMSSRPSTSRTSAPSTVSSGSVRIPLWSSPRPSSRAEHSIPSDTSPRIFRRSIAKSPGSIAPTGANGTTMPGLMLGAPHTTRRSPSP